MDAPVNVDYAGIDYARRGWSVIPLAPCGDQPLGDWRDFQGRIADREEIDDWAWRSPYANLGIVTGKVSRLVVLETDVRNGGAESLERLEKAHGSLPRTVEASTGSGRQLYFVHPGGAALGAGEQPTGIKVSGDGGYVVAPPSVDAKGRSYAWLPGCGPGDVAVAPLPPWLLALFETRG